VTVARSFNGSSDRGFNSSTPVGAVPLTIAAWFKTNDNATSQVIAAIARSAASSEYWALQVAGAVAGDPVRATANDSGINAHATTTTGITVGQWHHGCAVFASADSRAAYIDGGSKGTNTTNNSPDFTNQLSVGYLDYNGADTAFFNGDIAELAIWNVALTDAEVAILGAGASPLMVRPESLVFYAPLIGRYSPEIDTIGRFNLTLTGTGPSAHPPIRYPRSQPARRFTRAGGVTQISLSGTLSTSGQLADRVTIGRGGTLTTAGAVSVLARISRAGTLTTAGALMQRLFLARGGSLTTGGALASLSRLARSGTLSSSGSLIQRVLLGRAGTLTTAGAISSRIISIIRITLTATLTTAGSLRSTTRRALSATLTTSGGLSSVSRLGRAGSLATSGSVRSLSRLSRGGTLTTGAAIGSIVRLGRAGTLSPVGAVAMLSRLTRSGSLASSGALSQTIRLARAGTLTTAGALRQLVRLARSGVLSLAGAITAVFSGGNDQPGSATIMDRAAYPTSLIDSATGTALADTPAYGASLGLTGPVASISDSTAYTATIRDERP
jgi:hypothetical protein